MDKIGILGYGEVGKAIAGLYKGEVAIKDINGKNDSLLDIKVLNVCIPYSNDFSGIVENYIMRYEPELTIIHSTVKPHTTGKLQEGAPKGCYVVHSPIRGKHPDLHESILEFVKYVGSDTREGMILAHRHLYVRCGIKNVQTFMPSRVTEVGKLLSTTYYGLAIAWHGEMAAICEEYDISFEDAVTHFNETYNAGYSENGSAHFSRPVLSPPDKKIGGHCVIPNAKLLKQDVTSKALDLIMEYE